MNKKFSTLVASILLASSVGAYAQVPADPNAGKGYAMAAAIDFTAIPTKAAGITSVIDVTEADGGYVKGKAYFLKNGSDYLFAKLDAKGNTELLYGPVATNNLTEVNQALWVVADVYAPVGAIAPQYTFVNKATNTVLAMDKSKAVAIDKLSDGSNILGEGQSQWLSAPSYKNPAATAEPIYASIANDNIIAFAKGAQTTTTGVYEVVLASLKASDKGNAKLVTFKPGIADATAASTKFALTAQQLNTMLQAAGTDATSDSYFQLAFSPAATMDGKANKLAVDLQAMAVQQYEVKYGEKEDADASIIAGANYASFYEMRDADPAAANAKYSDVKKADIIGFNDNDNVWVTLKARDGKYLVVDTMYVDGTGQDQNPLITFGWDGLYNAKNESRYRDPRTYLFCFEYNPTTGAVDILSYAYAKSFYENVAAKKWVGGANGPAICENPLTYEGAYAYQPLEIGAKRYSYEAENIVKSAYISRAALGETSEVTLASDEYVLPTGKNYFKIGLGNSSAYQTTYIKSGAYLLKVTGSKHASRVGKYYVDNLKGGFEVTEQAIRQNFQHMPAAQWIIKSAGTTNGSPITIMNREFENAPSGENIVTGGIVYSAGVDNAFTMNGDTLEFIKVTAPLDEKLGYKYVANDTISESLFTFNYLHDLAMDKPINTKNDLDSVVWVDKDGNATKFMLEVVADDTYGTNNEVSGVSKNLTRRVYTVKVNDATKLQNDKRYLAYDSDSKKYKVAKDAKDLFFLKENNTADGTCYYAFVKANAYPVVTVKGNAISQRNGYMALDGEYIDGDIYLASMGTYYDPIDGLSNHEGYTVKVYDDLVAAKKAIAQINVNGAGYASPAKIVALGATPVAGEVIITNLANATDYANFVNKYVVLLSSTSTADYADYKVSVDNNTLDLVNGVLDNKNSQEVATSAFAVKRDADPLYRRFNTVNEGVATDAPDAVKFFRVNSSVKEYLYEDANSAYSKDKGFNFLGVEGKGDVKNASMYVDTAYVNRGTVMPQYLIALAPSIVKDSSVECPVCHGTDPNCDHNSYTRGYTEGRYLVNLQDSIDLNIAYNNVKVAEKYQWNRQYTRLGFVQARHLGDSLIIAKSMFTGDKTLLQPGKAATRASLDTINLANNMHKNVVFSFRIAKSGSNNFLIESETQQYDKDAKKEINVKNSKLETVKIAPEFGGWVKIQNGVPVLARGLSYNEAGLDAEVFNVEATSELPTENEDINATEVSIEAGNGNVTIKNAEGKTVAISNILGQALVNTVITSDNATISVPAGIVVVSVEGEEAAKVIVK